MPELPEVQTVAEELNKKLKNLNIQSVEVFHAKSVAIGPGTLSPKRDGSREVVKAFQKTLTGLRFLSVKRRAKLLIFDLSGPYSMLVHLKMTGQFIFETASLAKKTKSKYRLLNKLTAPLVQLPGKHTVALFTFTNGSKLYFNDFRRFGYLKLIKDSEVDQVKELQEFGPEPLEKGFTFEVFAKQIKRHRNQAIKTALMDARTVAGIGNIYSDEILFHAKVRPDRKVSTLVDSELKAIHVHIAPVLKKGIEAKGSSVGDFVRTDGTWGEMGKFHFVYGRKKQKCKKCSALLVSIKLGGRTSTYCPVCQK